MQWTELETDACLDFILNATDEANFKGRCDKYAATANRGAGTVVERYVWGLATRYNEYRGPGTYRTGRGGLPFSYAELYLIRLAYECRSAKDRLPPTPEYIANLFSRPLNEAKEAWHLYGPDKGRTGFGAKPQPIEKL